MHSVAKATTQELDLPFRSTISFAQPRFLSSSYQKFLRLEKSFAAYVNTYRDHDNGEINEYKLAGQDFAFDLLGLIDLLHPIVLLMLRGQLLWCPGWKIVHWVDHATQHMRHFSEEICKDKPAKSAAPTIHCNVKDIREMKFKEDDLVEGWLIEEKGKEDAPVKWKMRELSDCQTDLKELAEGMIEEMESRRADCLPHLLILLSNCLDFGDIFRCLVGIREGTQLQLDKPALARYGRDQFRRCVEFVAALPYVKEANDAGELALYQDCSEIIFWKLKETLMKVVWEDLFQSHFSRFFAKLKRIKRFGKRCPSQ